MHSKKILIVLVAALMVFASAQTSRAALNAVDPGPYVLANGFFPAWYQDANGLGLAPCLDLPAPLGTGFCVVLADNFFTPNSAVVFPTNWPTEFFYWIADADKVTLPAWIKIFRFSLEGAFAVVGPPTDGQQAVFQRIRFRFTPPVTGTYTITHPFGVKSFSGTVGVEIRDTTDIPLGIPLDFITALSGPEGPFLQWDPAVLPAAPAGYIGDAATPHAVIGSPTGNNFVRVDGPPGSNIGGAGIDFVGTNLFVVAGKITAVPLPTPLTVDRTTYGRTTTPAASQIDVFARSAPLATLTFNDGTVAANAMAKDTTGRFYGQSASTIPAVVPPAVHPTITVDASGAGNPSTFASNLTDVVTIAVAEYSVLGQTLTIDAASSDQVSAPVLTADGTITLTPGVPTIVPGVLAPPAFVTVTSSLGGSKSVPVVILP